MRGKAILERRLAERQQGGELTPLEAERKLESYEADVALGWDPVQAAHIAEGAVPASYHRIARPSTIRRAQRPELGDYVEQGLAQTPRMTVNHIITDNRTQSIGDDPTTGDSGRLHR